MEEGHVRGGQSRGWKGVGNGCMGGRGDTCKGPGAVEARGEGRCGGDEGGEAQSEVGPSGVVAHEGEQHVSGLELIPGEG